MKLSKHQQFIIDKLKNEEHEIHNNPMGYVEYALYSIKKQHYILGLKKSTVDALVKKGLIVKTKVNQILNTYKLKP